MSRPKLICIPYAGGNQHVFAPWRRLLNDRLDLVAPTLPGRGSRMAEAPIRSLPELVHWLLDELGPTLSGDFSFWGHSMGALLAYELTRSLTASGRQLPRHLFVSGRQPPRMPPTRNLHRADDATLTAQLLEMGGTPLEVLENEDLLSMVLPMLRADFEVCETYRWHPDLRRLAVPITAISGDRDPDVQLADLGGWREYTTGPVRIIAMAGDHFFLNAHVEALGDVFVQTLQPAVTHATSAG